MAQNDKKAAKRQTRAARRAAEAAMQRAKEEQAAKERKQQMIIGCIVAVVVIVLLVVAGVAIWRSVSSSSDDDADDITVEEAYDQLQDVEVSPSRADDQGGILISRDGYGTSVDDVPTVAIYMDFLCPGCGNLNRTLDDTLIEMMDAGQVNLELHFMAFMDRYSTDDYSSRAANAALYIAENDDDPSHLLGFMKNMYAEDFQPSEGSDYESVSDDQIRAQAIDAGVSEDVADGMFGGEYYDWLDAIDTYTPLRSELFNVTGSLKGSMSTPTVTINGYFWDMNELSLADVDTVDGMLESLGLDADDVGNEDALPSIGADGEPISVATGE